MNQIHHVANKLGITVFKLHDFGVCCRFDPAESFPGRLMIYGCVPKSLMSMRFGGFGILLACMAAHVNIR